MTTTSSPEQHTQTPELSHKTDELTTIVEQLFTMAADDTLPEGTYFDEGTQAFVGSTVPRTYNDRYFVSGLGNITDRVEDRASPVLLRTDEGYAVVTDFTDITVNGRSRPNRSFGVEVNTTTHEVTLLTNPDDETTDSKLIDLELSIRILEHSFALNKK